MLTLAMPQSEPLWDKKFSCAAERVGKDGTRQALIHRVLQRDGIIELFKLVDVQQRGKGLFSGHVWISTLWHSGDRRTDEVARLRGEFIDAGGASHQDFTPLGSSGLDGRSIRIDGFLVNEWPHQGAVGQGVANGDLFVGRHKSITNVIHNG